MIFKKGNIIEATEGYIAHGCNAQGVMGSGVAKAIREKWPLVYDRYMEFHARGCDKLGSYSWKTVDDGRTTVFNIISQENYGRDGRKYASYLAIVTALIDIIKHWGYEHNAAKLHALARGREVPDAPFQIALPNLIGCGLGGLRQEILLPLLIEIEEQYNTEFVIYGL